MDATLLNVLSGEDIQTIFALSSGNFQTHKRKDSLKIFLRLRYFNKNDLHGANRNSTNLDPQKDVKRRIK